MKIKYKLIIFDRFDTSILKPLEFLEIKQAKESDKENIILLIQAHALIVRSKTKIHEDFLRLCPKLKLIVTATSGFDHIDLANTQKRNITVMHTPKAHIASAAELTLCLLQSLFRKLFLSREQMKTGHWNRQSLIGTELEGKKIGLIGLGRIGSRVARILKGYGCQIHYYDPYLSSEKKGFIRHSSLDSLIKYAEVVSLHVPLSSETYHMINEQIFSKMLPDSVLINSSRGPIVQEKSLLRALHNKQIAGAGLDVFEQEPLPKNHPFLLLENVTLTPHLGATTQEALTKASQEALNKVCDYFTQKPLTDTLPPQAPWYQNSQISTE